MIVETTNTTTRRIASDDVLEAFEDTDAEPRPVEFNDDGRARVPAAVGEYLAETREGVTVAVDERKDADDEDT